MSKGSTRRPTQVPKDEAERRWEKTFGWSNAEARKIYAAVCGHYDAVALHGEPPTERFMWHEPSIRHVWDADA